MTSTTVATTTAAARPRLQGILAALLQADVQALIKNRRSFLMGLLVPLALLVVTSRQQSQQRLGGTLLIVGLSLTIGLLSTSIMGYAISVARDRDAGIFQRLRVTPAPGWAIMASRLTVQLLADLVIAVVVVVAGVIIDHVALTVGQAVFMLVIAILASAAFLSIGQALVGLLKSAETVNSTGRLVYIGLVFLGLLGVTGILGSTIESLARWSPVGVVMELFAAAGSISQWDARDTLSVLACVAYAVVFAAVGIRWFQWDAAR
ncbi:MAG TPA: ABC transporter permease [Thermomicrobiaceae bacterium]|nr:ABC transporter permease [Thermomicrobiaceae bacterium]